MNQANQTFEAHAFHPDLGNEVAVGEIVVGHREFQFRSEILNLTAPLHRLQVRVGEGDDERIYFQDPQAPEWEVFTTDFEILDHPLIPQAQAIRDKLTKSATNQEVFRRLRLVGYVLLGIIIIAWLANFSVGVMIGALVERVPPQLEQKLGAEAMAEMQDMMSFLDDTNRLARLEQLIAPLTNAISVGTNGLKLFIADEEDPNAFALPGGTVVVTTGMLNLVDRPEELLGVVAHELAHVKKKHGIRSMISGAGPFLMFGVLLGGQGGVVGLLGSATDLVVRSGFSQEYETEADDIGWQMLVAAKIDPRGMTDSFRKLQAYEGKNGEADFMPQAFSSHPEVKKRIARLEKKWQKLKTKTGFRDLSELDVALKEAAGK